MLNLYRVINASLKRYVRWERWVLLVLGSLFLLSLAISLTKFYFAETMLIPTTGGTYIEGSVGELQPLNPWFTVTNDVNRDIVSLVFAGLLKYNPQTKAIEEDLATLEASKDGKVFTVRLKENLFWHDSTKEKPHPVTADDVLFTFKTIQDGAFPNSLLRQNFKGVSIERINDRTVQFRLEEPYSYFTSNLTIGLLPKASFDGIPIENLDQALDFGFEPIGAGPYKFKSIIQTDLSSEVTLERFERQLSPIYRLDRIVLRIFADYSSLLSDIRNLDGVRVVPHTESGMPAVPRRFTTRSYTLPQYVALFFNVDRKVLQDQKLRLGLQLGTNKQEIVDAVGESVIIDTPLLQIDAIDWRYKFDAAAAQGALFESQWYFPEKIRLQRLLEQREANMVGPLKLPPLVLLDTGAVLSLSGSYARLSRGSKIHGLPVTDHPTASGSWVLALPTVRGTGSLKLGTNLVKLTDEKGKVLDSFYVWRTSEQGQFRRAKAEQELIDVFLASRNPSVDPAKKIGSMDTSLDEGFLRKRVASDPIGIRINDAGQRLSLTLLTSPSPGSYGEVAEIIKSQWAALGVHVAIDIPETRAKFEERILERNYDLLLFGQSLLDNLDSYPYWHSSGVQNVSGKRSDLKIDAYNLSQYASFEADALLETVRQTTRQETRVDALKKLSDVLKRDAAAIVLYSPLYSFAHRQDILGIELGSLSMHSDRFLTLHRWYVKQDRVFKAGKSWFSFFGWLSSLLSSPSSPESV